MKITRWGAAADHGRTGFDFDASKAHWSPKEKLLSVGGKANSVFSGKSRHNYEVSFSATDIGALVSALDSAPPEDRPGIATAMAPHLRALVRLAAIASGLA